MKVLRIMTEYGCFPLWKAGGEIGNVDPNELTLSNALQTDLRQWADLYDGILNHEDPSSSGFACRETEEAFEAKGHRLWRRLQAELGIEYKVVFFNKRDARLLE